MTFSINFTKFCPKDQGSKLNPLLMICRIRSLLLYTGFLIQIIVIPADGIRNNIHRNVSELLDDLLRGYDNSIRPDFGGPALIVDIDIVVRSMGPISEIDMSYSMDCYFRQSWIDQRLSYRSYEKGTLALSISMLERIWLTIKASCRMNLENFPMDIQRCPLKLGSFAYTTRDVLYRWKNVNRTVDIAKDMKMSQFDLISNPSGNSTEYMKSGEYSFLSVSFHLQRHTGNFLIQVYGPCTLLVVMSWVSFWLNREATAERVSLGITTILTMTFLGLEARIDLPKVPYPTALDFFVFLSFLFIFATIIQFAIVHYFTKYGSGEEYFMEESSSEEEEDEDEITDFDPEQAGSMSIIGIGIPPPPAGFSNNNGGVGRRFAGIGQQIIVEERQPPPPPPPQASRPTSWPFTFKGHRQGEGRVRSEGSKVRESRRLAKIQRQSEMGRVNSVSKIDIFARIAFPLSFFLINVFYWYSYLYSEQMLML